MEAENKTTARFVMAEGSDIDHLQLAMDMLQLASNEPARNQQQIGFFFRKAEIAALIAIAKSNRSPVAEQAERSAKAWEETAAQFAKNESFYRGLLVEVGKVCGIAARLSDDGKIQQDVLVLKVPELVRAAYANLQAAVEIIRSQKEHFHYCEAPCEPCEDRRKMITHLLGLNLTI